MKAQTAQKKIKPTVMPKGKSREQHYEGQHANVQSILHGSRIQPKLSVGQPNDKYEQEADRVAEQVMRMPAPQPRSFSSADNPPPENSNTHSGTIQRACTACEGEYKTAEIGNRSVDSTSLCPNCQAQEKGLIQTKQVTSLIQRQVSLFEEQDEELIQTKVDGSITPEVTPAITTGIQSLQGGGQPLSKSERSFFEPRIGADFSNVRVHSDSRAAGLTRSINARAFTHGHNVVFGAGEYSPNTTSGRKLLAHELTHVVQQGRNNEVIQRLDGDPSRVELTYASGVNETRRILRVCSNGTIHFSPHGYAHISNFSSIRHDDGTLFSVTPESLRVLYQAIEMHPISCPATRGAGCSCDSSTNVAYNRRVMRFIRSIRGLIQSQARRKGVPPTAIAGAIADEYRTREFPRSIVDSSQDNILDSLSEWQIDVDRFFDFDSKFLNAMENDVGPANINVRTATQMVEEEGLVVPNSPQSNIQVSEIIDFLLTNAGTVETTAVVLRRAKNRFDPYLWAYPSEKYDSVLVEYFKQGDGYYRRAIVAVSQNADHEICPGNGGCRVINNYERLSSAVV